jgi:hypothetical protein
MGVGGDAALRHQTMICSRSGEMRAGLDPDQYRHTCDTCERDLDQVH